MNRAKVFKRNEELKRLNGLGSGAEGEPGAAGNTAPYAYENPPMYNSINQSW